MLYDIAEDFITHVQSSKLKRIYVTFGGLLFKNHFLRYIESP